MFNLLYPNLFISVAIHDLADDGLKLGASKVSGSLETC